MQPDDLVILMKYVFCTYYGTVEEQYEYYMSTDVNGKDVEVMHGFYYHYSSENPLAQDKVYYYQHGKLHGMQKEYEWDFSAQIEDEGEFDNGVPIGEHKSYSYRKSESYNNGNEYRETRVGTYVNGMLHGTVVEMLDDGTVVSSSIYDNGTQISMWQKSCYCGYAFVDRAFKVLADGSVRGLSWDQSGRICADWVGTLNNPSSNMPSYTQIVGSSDDLVITKYTDYEEFLGNEFIRAMAEFDTCGNALSATTFFPSGRIHENFIVVPNPNRKLRSSASGNPPTNVASVSGPGVPWSSPQVYMPDDYISQGLQRLEYYESGALKTACMKNGRKLEGEFRFYLEDGTLHIHEYYVNGNNVLSDMLEVACCNDLDEMDEDAEVFLTLQYGALLLTPKELLCPLK